MLSDSQGALRKTALAQRKHEACRYDAPPQSAAGPPTGDGGGGRIGYLVPCGPHCRLSRRVESSRPLAAPNRHHCATRSLGPTATDSGIHTHQHSRVAAAPHVIARGRKLTPDDRVASRGLMLDRPRFADTATPPTRRRPPGLPSRRLPTFNLEPSKHRMTKTQSRPSASRRLRGAGAPRQQKVDLRATSSTCRVQSSKGAVDPRTHRPDVPGRGGAYGVVVDNKLHRLDDAGNEGSGRGRGRQPRGELVHQDSRGAWRRRPRLHRPDERATRHTAAAPATRDPMAPMEIHRPPSRLPPATNPTQ